MRRSAKAALLAVLAALSAACSSAPAAAPDASVTGTSTTTSGTSTPSSTASTPARSARGLLAKGIGQQAGFSTPAGVDQATFTLDAITVDDPCTGPYPKAAEQGHMVVLSFTVTTAATLLPEEGWHIRPADFALVGPDGVTDTNLDTTAALMCLADRDLLPTEPYAPASKYVGKIALDTRHPAGTVLYRPQNMRDGGGWEWPMP
ncbi:hypothetical protein ACQPW3_10695 [Actinosynnema sp. CA-248983]